MPDQPQKPLALYVVLEELYCDSYSALAFTDPNRANRWACKSRVYAGKYEPAVGRCKTCAHFRDPSLPAFPEAWCVILTRTLSNDGSGYCHEHLKKGGSGAKG